MDTNKLSYFAVVAQTENIRKAAEILKLTPSALSKTIKQLEDELGVHLLTPLGRGITLTREGKELAVQAASILESMTQLKNRVQDASKEKKTAPLRIATFEVFSTYFLQVLEQVDMGDRNIVMHEVTPGELEQVIDQGKADFGITYMPIAHPSLEHTKITSILMGVYKRKGSFEDLPQEELPFVVPVLPLTGVPTRVKGLDGWPDDAYHRKVKYEVTLLESALELCRQGKCVGYFPSFIAHRHNHRYQKAFQLERHPYKKNRERCYSDVFLVKRKDRAEDRDARLISKLVRIGTRLELVD
jgi:DNA-binding transcriptional LysR family regulator